ncbi:MAG: hypothetical protein L6U16_11015 [Porphyromonadaceae bacterium]|nr:MAG: hypothetical protein L6U16_11015 [Porphyromonadaceae bacterium]
MLFALAPQAVAMPDSVYVCLVNGEVENHSVAAIDSIAFQIFNAIPEKDDSLNVCHKDGKTTSYALYMVDSLAFKKPAAQQSAQWVAVDLGLSVKWCNMNVGASAPEDCGGFITLGAKRSKKTITPTAPTYIRMNCTIKILAKTLVAQNTTWLM